MSRRAVISIVAVVVVVNVVLYAVARLVPSPSGPESSTYATTRNGFAAWAELLERNGHPVVRERRLPADVSPAAGSTAVVLDPDAVTPDDAHALEQFVAGGGRLVAGGPLPVWLGDVLARLPAWRPRGPRFWEPAGGGPDLAGVGHVETVGRASFGPMHWARSELAAAGSSLVATVPHGRGTVVLVADSSALQNRLLAHRDNALLALRLAGAPGTPAVFYESLHGYGSGRGLAALPAHWKLALILFGAAALLWLLARARRLGPPEAPADAGPPPRRLYVDALAATLARTHAPADASDPLRREALAALLSRTGHAATRAADPREVERLGRSLGLEPEEAHALVRPPSTDADLVALGAAAAKLRAGKR
ncbi:MAG: DUF4350 domain-containing protein [Thermoleophilaceae bacterium]